MIRIVHDGRIGRFDVPKFARCPNCDTRVGEPHRDLRVLGCAMTCPKCAKKFLIPFAHPTHAQKLTAPNCPNGNPGRVWVLYDQEGRAVDAIDEGYSGRPMVVKTLNLTEIPTIQVSRGEYRDWLRVGEEATGYRENR